ncbi:dihydrofolate reductase family protein [Micromonospora sp. WMMD736]|uniref:dihydrofolate reductase family protein n=1 Tax=Micromonospora sp. WMMD736 TaxID=3404112 RepID=UPI003B92F294
MQMSLDGFAEGPDNDAHWPVVDEELSESFLDQLAQADMFLYGRKTYEIMARFWPWADGDPAISPFYVDFARCWKQTPKVVFSNTLASAPWNTTVLNGNLLEEVTELKARRNCAMVLFGGAQTASAFMKHNLIDEYRLFVHPVLLGGGTALFPTSAQMAGLELVDVTTFDSAVVHVHYQRAAQVAA